jgi:EAL domain-containing protein (putative c-di-GMP-specific phosphodiesterase class I)
MPAAAPEPGRRTACRSGLGERTVPLDHFVSTVADAVGRTGIAPALLQLELTESTLLADVEQTVTNINEFRSMRIELAIDDFGTGHSSASYLKRFPFTTVKIDRSFVQGLTGNGYSGHLIEPIAALAHRFGMTVVIEGIETARQLQAVRESGCDEAQGYLLGRPLRLPRSLQGLATGIENTDGRRIGEKRQAGRDAAARVHSP